MDYILAACQTDLWSRKNSYYTFNSVLSNVNHAKNKYGDRISGYVFPEKENSTQTFQVINYPTMVPDSNDKLAINEVKSIFGSATK